MLDVGNSKVIEAENVFVGKKVLAADAGPLFMPYPYALFNPERTNRITRVEKSQANETKKRF